MLFEGLNVACSWLLYYNGLMILTQMDVDLTTRKLVDNSEIVLDLMECQIGAEQKQC